MVQQRQYLPARCVALISLVVGIQTNVCYGRLSAELDVDEMGLRTVRLPVGVQGAVNQLINSETCRQYIHGLR